MSFKAEYGGVCGDCGEDIIKGQYIQMKGGHAVHDGCAPTDVEEYERSETFLPLRERVSRGPLKLVRPACPNCHLELPASGICGSC